jgi:hypothetical protein
MSNMLEQAIIDADSLKEAARQSAEEKIVEHFSKDIKEAVNMILEQEVAPGDLSTMAATSPYDPTMMDPTMMGDPTAMGTPETPSMVDIEADKNTKDNGKFVVDQLPYATTTDSKTFVSIDLDRLEESIREGLEENALDSLHLEEEYDLEEATLLDEDSMVEGDDDDDDDDNTTNESIEKMIRSVLAEEMEDLFESDDDSDKEDEEEDDDSDSDDKDDKDDDSDSDDKGGDSDDKGNGLTAAQKKLPKGLQNAIKKESVELKTKNKTLITEQKTLNKKVSLLEGKLEKYGTVIEKLKDKLNETNLANAKLLYQNRVLDSDSLNERQKDRIVETIMNAKTVEEAKIIYETLQSAVGANSLTRRPKSLNEVVTKRSSAFMPRKEEKRVDPFTARMKALAGIKD